MHPTVNWFHGGRPIFGELVDKNSPDAPPRRQRVAAAAKRPQQSQSAPIVTLTDQEVDVIAHIECENALAGTSLRLGVVLCRHMGIDPVVTLDDVLRNILEERIQDHVETTTAVQEDSIEERPSARRSVRTSVPSRKKGKGRKV
ncbi:unnamed protein product [Aphanomyces euteiches]